MNSTERAQLKSKEKKLLSQTGRVNSGDSISRKKPLSKNSKDSQSRSKKSIVNSFDLQLGRNGSECGSAKKPSYKAKDPGFKQIKTKAMGGTVNKENNKKEMSVGKKVDRLLFTNVLNTKSGNTLNTPRNKSNSSGYLNLKGEEKPYSHSKQVTSVISRPASLQCTLTAQCFEIGKKLGRGRFGDVYMVRQKRLGFIMAMKIINKKELKESDMTGQLVFQIKIQSFISHPNTLRMYGYFSDDKNIYLLLELASNGCLFRQLKAKVKVDVTQGNFRQDQVAYYLRQVIAGLKHLHGQSIMHRDIKPENILNSFGVLKLCDFGWAVYSPLYQRQTFCGTLDYVPPEIVVGQYYDEKVDLWCIGVLCYELCTGRAPFEAKENELETYDKILAVDLQFPVNLSVQVVDFISRLLTKDPQSRMTFPEMEEHPFMKKYENESGRMISREIWESWHQLRC